MAPKKPPTTLLRTEMLAATQHFGADGKLALVDLLDDVAKAEVENDDWAKLADWEREATAVDLAVERVAGWNGRAKLPI
ncbi:hypothetical protein K0817_017435 [Microbacterium sp. HD4P20]|uniref:hypothetical protein n=1 Tax=Microbacterium sp. HD4P20 TaxID=2864874 RepID=UPI001C63F15A|nr:hypothetical protein [Microbacterium sp. HD4P20]MCP2638339.1 hypothetical protein [Microbacterium sp. HD4P20]